MFRIHDVKPNALQVAWAFREWMCLSECLCPDASAPLAALAPLPALRATLSREGRGEGTRRYAITENVSPACACSRPTSAPPSAVAGVQNPPGTALRSSSARQAPASPSIFAVEP